MNDNNIEGLEENIHTDADGESASLSLDTSVLMDRNSVAQHAAIMDQYGIRVFDKDVEAQIRDYLLKEQNQSDYYRAVLFLKEREAEDKEINTIRNEVFSISYAASRGIENRNDLNDSQQTIGLLVVMCLISLGVGLGYGRYKKKEREKKLADINNSYDE